jgi:glycosyltransferase involved in cell wall biosynthesis
MRVLMITGDRNFGPGNPRYELQRSQVDELAVVCWGRGSLWPKLPKENFDVVTVQDPFWRGLFAWKVARQKKARFNVQVHTDLDAQTFVRHVLSQIVLLHADSVRAVSEKIKNRVLRFGVKSPVHVLPVFIDVAPFKTLTHIPHPRFKKTILWLGRFEDEKDPLYALEVLKQVRAKNIDAGLVMLGKGSLEKTLRSRTTRLDLVEHAEIIPWGDPKPYLQMADVVLCTSRHESWGASIVEALAAGAPVVAPDVGVAREAGAIVADRAELAQKVIEVLEQGTRGELKIQLLHKEAWAHAWKETLQ